MDVSLPDTEHLWPSLPCFYKPDEKALVLLAIQEGLTTAFELNQVPKGKDPRSVSKPLTTFAIWDVGVESSLLAPPGWCS